MLALIVAACESTVGVCCGSAHGCEPPVSDALRIFHTFLTACLEVSCLQQVVPACLVGHGSHAVMLLTTHMALHDVTRQIPQSNLFGDPTTVMPMICSLAYTPVDLGGYLQATHHTVCLCMGHTHERVATRSAMRALSRRALMTSIKQQPRTSIVGELLSVIGLLSSAWLIAGVGHPPQKSPSA